MAITNEFRHETTVRLAHTDAAGLLFFSNQFLLAHEAYEEWLRAAGFSMIDVIRKGEILIPIVHCEGDYLAPLLAGDRLMVKLNCHSRSEHAFTLGYEFVRGSKIVGRATTVHVCVARKTMSKIAPPDELAAALTAISVAG